MINEDKKLAATVALLSEAANNYSPAILATALGVPSMILVDLIATHGLDIEVVTVDTGRLPSETHELMQSIMGRYGPILKVLFPDPVEISSWVQANGSNGFYQSVELRKECCRIRKVNPLKSALKGKKAWVTGLRREESAARSDIETMAWDDAYGLYKFNPMADWVWDDVWSYIHGHKVPYNKLMDKGYKSVGCAPCSRAVRPGEDERAGRWWWERGTLKECGIHVDPKTGKLTRNEKSE